MAEGGQAGKAVSPPGGGLERAGALAADVRGRLMALSAGRRGWLGAGALTALAVVAGMAWYGARPDWRVLYSGLDGKDTQQVAQELTAAGISTRMTDDGGGVEVDADQLDKARMEVATKGMPQSGRMGFELFDKPNWVGSEFDEKVNYQRALEGELEHTIGTLAAVRSARVHLVLPKDSMFGEEQQKAKASVVLQLRRSAMPPEQVEAIRSLVAGAVENLAADDVALVDADGRLNLAAPGRGAVAGDAERALEEKLVAMIEPAAGGGNVRATVNVAYDDSSEEKTDEVYDPAQVAALSIHKTQQTTAGRMRTGGIPGTASNTPGPAVAGGAQASGAAAQATAAAVPPLLRAGQSEGSAPAEKDAGQKDSGLPVYPESGSGGQTMTEETGTYAVTRHLLHTEMGPGRVRRVTAAVVVNDRMESEGTGKGAHTVWKPRSPAEMQRIGELARAAVGFDATRGDQVVVENVSFSSNVPEAAPVGMAKVMDETDSVLHAQPGLLKSMSFAAVGLLLVMVVLKPMTRQMMTALSQTSSSALPAATGGQAASAAPRGGRTFAQAAMGELRRPTDTQGMYEQISDQIRKEPAQSTRLLESWINAPVEEDD